MGSATKEGAMLKQWALEVALPWWWRRGVIEQVVWSIFWTDGPGVSVAFTRDERWTLLRTWTSA